MHIFGINKFMIYFIIKYKHPSCVIKYWN